MKAVRAAVAAAIADAPGRIGVACSGGADSVALLDAALAARANVVALHVDHALHPASVRTAAEVGALARSLGADAEILRVTVTRGASLEDQARRARYAALEAAAGRLGLACVLGGHTARDQAETVLLRVLRGTGPAGLAGIPPVRGVHRRPLLAIPRDVIERYVAARGLPVIEDPMNTDPAFARVRVRHAILPALAAENPRLEDALLRLARSAAEWTAAIDAQATALAKSGKLPIARLRAAGPAIAKRALQLLAPQLEAEHLDAAHALIDARSGQGIDVLGGRIERAYAELVVVREVEPPPPLDVVGPGAPYTIRPWRAGDRMRPARLRGRSRKLSDLYADAKVPKATRATARVVLDATGSIVWAEHLGPAFDATISVTCPM